VAVDQLPARGDYQALSERVTAHSVAAEGALAAASALLGGQMEALQKELSAKVAACEDGRQADAGAIRRTADADRWGVRGRGTQDLPPFFGNREGAGWLPRKGRGRGVAETCEVGSRGRKAAG
jgi:hypothetical protein